MTPSNSRKHFGMGVPLTSAPTPDPTALAAWGAEQRREVEEWKFVQVYRPARDHELAVIEAATTVEHMDDSNMVRTRHRFGEELFYGSCRFCAALSALLGGAQ